MILERGSITTTGASAIAVWSTDGASLTGTSLSIRTEGGQSALLALTALS